MQKYKNALLKNMILTNTVCFTDLDQGSEIIFESISTTFIVISWGNSKHWLEFKIEQP